MLFPSFFSPKKIIREKMLQELIGIIKDVLDPISVNLIEIMPESIRAFPYITIVFKIGRPVTV